MRKYLDLLTAAENARRTAIVDEDFSEKLHKLDSAIRRLRSLPKTPIVVCLCGSTKFKDDFERVAKEMALDGIIVLSVGCFMHADSVPLSVEQKATLDGLHKRKIDLSDYVYVINRGGYIGESTASEIAYAKEIGTGVIYMENLKGGWRNEH